MGSVIGWLIGKRIFGKVIGERGARFIAYASLILAIIAAFAIAIAMIRNDAVDDNQAKIERRARPANDKAANERAQDTINNAKSEQERKDAIQAQPDQPITPTSRALACDRLRRAGRTPPACQ